MTRTQQRAVVLITARYQLRQLHVNLLEVSALDAHKALDDYARRYPAMIGSQWYHTASESELQAFTMIGVNGTPPQPAYRASTIDTGCWTLNANVPYNQCYMVHSAFPSELY